MESRQRLNGILQKRKSLGLTSECYLMIPNTTAIWASNIRLDTMFRLEHTSPLEESGDTESEDMRGVFFESRSFAYNTLFFNSRIYGGST